MLATHLHFLHFLLLLSETHSCLSKGLFGIHCIVWCQHTFHGNGRYLMPLMAFFFFLLEQICFFGVCGFLEKSPWNTLIHSTPGFVCLLKPQKTVLISWFFGKVCLYGVSACGDVEMKSESVVFVFLWSWWWRNLKRMYQQRKDFCPSPLLIWWQAVKCSWSPLPHPLSGFLGVCLDFLKSVESKSYSIFF